MVAIAVELSLFGGVGAVGVVEDGALRGIFTERDVMLRVVLKERDPKLTKVSEVMNDLQRRKALSRDGRKLTLAVKRLESIVTSGANA